MKQKKLIIFYPSIEDGGAEKNLFLITNYLAKNIKNTILITSSRKFNKKFKNIQIINPKKDLSNSCGRKLKYFYCLFELVDLLLKNNQYVLFAFQANLYCALVGIFFPKLKILTRSNSSLSGWSKNFFKKLIFKALFKRINKVIVNSIQFKKEINKKFNVKAQCIYNPLNSKEIINLSKKKLNFPFFNTNKLKIISIGRLVEQKDHLIFLKALNILKKKIEFRALIIGNGENKKYLLDFIKKNQLNKNVKIINFRSNPFVFLKKADLLVHTATFEGLPNVLLEAILLNKYVISTNCPTGPSEILNNGKGGDLVKIRNFLDLSNKIENYFLKKKSFNKKKIFAMKNLERFDYNENSRKYLITVNKFLNKN